MKTQIVRIGNSRGIRIPKPLLEQVGLFGEVDIIAEANSLVIRPIKKPRDGWASAFQEMARRGDDVRADGVSSRRPHRRSVREQRRLGIMRERELLGRSFKAEAAERRAERGVGAIEDRLGGGIRLREVFAHAGLLRTLTWKE